MRNIYLDFNASTPVAPEVAGIMRHALETGHGNPSSSHWAGVPARQMVEDGRRQVAALLGCAPHEIIFTSGGSEANNHALKGNFFASGRDRPHFIASSVEHPAIVAPSSHDHDRRSCARKATLTAWTKASVGDGTSSRLIRRRNSIQANSFSVRSTDRISLETDGVLSGSRSLICRISPGWWHAPWWSDSDLSCWRRPGFHQARSLHCG